MTQLQALIFDLDGTLAETERDGHRIAFNRAFADAGLNWVWSEELYGDLLMIAGGKERIQHFIETHLPKFEFPIDPTPWIAELHHNKTVHYQQLIKEGIISVRPGVKRLLTEARDQGVRLAIATTSAYPTTIALLEAILGSDSPTWFEVIAAGDIVPRKKPAPDIYHYVLQKMGLSRNQALVIEDSHQGVQASTQAGLPTVVTVNGYTHSHDFTGATLILTHLGEPDQPFQVLGGKVGTSSYFTIKLAHQIVLTHQD